MPTYTQKTIFMAHQETCRTKKIPAFIMDYSTLNEKHNILSGQVIPDGSYPEYEFLVIGNGGHSPDSGNVGSIPFDILQHSATDAALFNQMPFIMRPKDNDLSAQERQRYRHRSLEEYNGTEYWVYRLRLLELSNESPRTQILTTENTVTSSIDFEPSPAMLKPTPLAVQNGKLVDRKGRQVSVQSAASFTLTREEIREIINCATIIHNDPRMAIISEVAIVSGFDKTHTSTEGGINATYTETIAAQIATHMGVFDYLDESSRGLTYSFDIGDVLPYKT